MKLEQQLWALFPGMSARLVYGLARTYYEQGMPAILALTDADFMAIRNFGQRMLVEFRSRVGRPYEQIDLFLAHASAGGVSAWPYGVLD